jgi:tetratricopeptide (TPR) repeat protein
MMSKLSLTIRIVIALVLGGLILWVVFGNGEPTGPDKLVGLILSVCYGFVLFVLFGWALLQQLGERIGSVYLPSDKNFRIMPEYSKAEARLKVGDYTAAVAEFRQVVARFPDDIYAHVQIGQICADHLHDLATAETELLTACTKAGSADSIVMAHNRLADLYQFKLQNPTRALEVMTQLRTKLPDTKAAERAGERVNALQEIIRGFTPAKPPEKITYRPIDEETRRQRRGY